MGDFVADFEEFCKDDIHDREHHERAQKCPEVAED